EIAAKVGIYTDSDYRIRSGIFYTLMQSIGEGHVYLLKDALTWRAGRLLEVEIDNIEKYLMDLAMEKKVVLKEAEDGVRVYSSRFYYMELNVAKMLHDLNISEEVSRERLLERLGKIEDATGLFLDEMQRKAVMEAA